MQASPITGTPPSELKDTAREAGVGIKETMDELYFRAFVDTGSWGDYGAAFELFDGEAQARAEADVEVLTLGPTAKDDFEALDGPSGTLTIAVLTDKKDAPATAIAEVQFLADAQGQGQHDDRDLEHRIVLPPTGRRRLDDLRLPRGSRRSGGRGTEPHGVAVMMRPKAGRGSRVARGGRRRDSAWRRSRRRPPRACPSCRSGRRTRSSVPRSRATSRSSSWSSGATRVRGRHWTKGLCDSIHILGINPKAKRATLVGIPRDSYVPIATGGTNKINVALAQGGAKGMIATVEDLTGVTFDYYVITGFDGMKRIFDALGRAQDRRPLLVRGTRGDLVPGREADAHRVRRRWSSRGPARRLRTATSIAR